MNWTGWASGEYVEAAVGMLANSLWLGAVFALAAGGIVLFTRHSSATVRYNLLLATLVAFIAALAICFFYQRPGPVLPGLQPLAKKAREHAPILFITWLLPFAYFFARLCLGLYATRRLAGVAATPAGQLWAGKLASLSLRMGLKRKPRLAEPRGIQSPAAAGFLRPSILLPAGLIASLPPETADMILLHELAHIRRQDFIVHVFMRLARAVLFFNPAIWWLCSLLEAERENCCDDLAIRTCGDRLGYARALVYFSESQARRPGFAVAWAGGMLGRLERLATGQNRPLRRWENICLACILALFSLAAWPNKPEAAVYPGHSPGLLQEAKAKAEAAALQNSRHSP